MTADHAGRTGGEREDHLAAVAEWYRRRGCCGELFSRTVVCSEPRNHAPISAAMGWLHAEDFLMRDQAERALVSRPVPVPGQPDARGRVGCDCGAGLSSCAPGCACDSCDRMRGRAGQAARERDTDAPERDTTVLSAAREAAVEAVALMWREHRYDAETRLCTCGVMEHPSWAGHHVGQQLLSLPAVVALSAAPGQEPPAHEWNCPSCGATTRARMADQDDDHGDCFEVCQGHPR